MKSPTIKVVELQEMIGSKLAIKSSGCIFVSPAMYSLYTKEKGLALDAFLRSLNYTICEPTEISSIIKQLTAQVVQ